MSVAEARDFLDRFVGRFRAEDTNGLKRLFTLYGATYSYLGDAGFSAEDENREIFKRLRVVNYRLSDARISTSGTGAVVRATYSYGDKLSKTESGRPWLHTGIVTFQLRDDGENVGVRRIVVVYPHIVISATRSTPTTITARASTGSKRRILVGSTRRHLPAAGEYFIVIPLNATGRAKVRAGSKIRVRIHDTAGGRPSTLNDVGTPFAS